MNETIKIREVTEADAPGLLAIYAPYVRNTAITFEYEVPSEEEFAKRIQSVLKKYPYIAAEKNGKLLGYAYTGAFKGRAAYDWAVETSIYIAEDGRRKGLGKRLYEALEDILKQQGILNMYACIACPEVNDAHLDRNSVEFHAHLGYRLVGEFSRCGYKFDTWYNMVWMEKLIGDHRQNQKKIKRYPEIRETIDFDRY